MIDEQKQIIEDVIANLHEKYVKKGNPHKIMQDIITNEKIKYRETAEAEDNFCGIYTKSNNDTLYIVVNSNISNIGRKNFTIAHELGHHFLKHKLSAGCYVNEGSNDTKDPQEKQANYFASLFLMPQTKITEAFNAIKKNVKKIKIGNVLVVNEQVYKSVYEPVFQDSLTKSYGVSAEALRYRLEALNLIKWIMAT